MEFYLNKTTPFHDVSHYKLFLLPDGIGSGLSFPQGIINQTDRERFGHLFQETPIFSNPSTSNVVVVTLFPTHASDFRISEFATFLKGEKYKDGIFIISE